MSNQCEVIRIRQESELERRVALAKQHAKESVERWRNKKEIGAPVANVNVSENPVPYPDREILYPDRGKISGL